MEHEDLRGDDDVVADEEAGLGVQHRRQRREVAPPVGLLLAGEAVPRVAPDRLCLVALVCHAEPVAGEAVPLGAAAARVRDLQVYGDVPRERLRVP